VLKNFNSRYRENKPLNECDIILILINQNFRKIMKKLSEKFQLYPSAPGFWQVTRLSDHLAAVSVRIYDFRESPGRRLP